VSGIFQSCQKAPLRIVGNNLLIDVTDSGKFIPGIFQSCQKARLRVVGNNLLIDVADPGKFIPNAIPSCLCGPVAIRPRHAGMSFA
jgi:hypothetical protein